MKQLKKQELLQNGIIDASIHTLDSVYEVHRHDFFEIEYILSGTGSYVINGNRHPIEPGMLFFMTPADFHAVESCDMTVINLMLSHTRETADALFSLTVRQASSTSRAFQPTGTARQLIELLLEETVEALKKADMAYAMRLSSVVLSKLAQIAPEEPSQPGTYVKDAVLYLLSHFTEPITLSQTAKHVGISQNYLSELFHAQTNMRFKAYLAELRLDYISKLLLYSDLPISEISLAGGFADYVNFVRRFKEKYGQSPAAWRRNAQNNTCNFRIFAV